MNKSYGCGFIGILALAILALSLPVFARTLSEDELVADLASARENVVIDALQKIEKQYPASPNALSAVKKLLADPRPKVQRKAARVLGAVNAEVDATDIQNICTLLKSADTDAIIDGLKALRGLKAQSAIPQIVPLLNHPNKSVIRDSCRTLSVLGDKSLVPTIRPLLTYPDLAVQKDAADAISILKEK